MMHDWRSCTSVPTSLQRRRHLERLRQAGEKGVDLGVDHRQVDLADAEHRVAEREHVGAVDVGHRARGDGAHVAAHQLDADRRARARRGRAPAAARACGRRPPAAAPGPSGAARRLSSATVRGVKPETDSGTDARTSRGSPPPVGGDSVGRPRPRASAAGDRRRASAPAPRSARSKSERRRAACRAACVAAAAGQHLFVHAARAAALGEHRLDRRDAAERLLGEAPGVGDGAHQLAVDVDRAAAHAGDDAGELDARVLGADQDDVLLGQEVAHHRRRPGS